MRYSKLGLLSTLSVVALLTASNTSTAFAPSVTDMGLLRPQNSWQVTDIDAKNASYCAMVSQFDKQISLAFARSPSGSGSLAISFPGDILDAGMSYQVGLQVDDLQTRRYEVRAASSSSLIVQIGRDEEFYNALGGNGTLRISMPNMNMRFDLAKFSGSYISLVSCANKLARHEGPRTAALPVTPVERTSLTGAKTKTAAASPTTPVPLNAKAAALAHDPSFTWTTAAERGQSPVKADTTSLIPASAPHTTENAVAENIDLRSRLSQIAIEQNELTNSVNLLKSEKYDLQAKLDMKEKQLQLLQAAMSAKDRDLASVRSVSNNDSKSLADLQAQLASLKRDHDQSMADLQMRLSEKTAQYDTLQKQFTDATQARRAAQDKNTQAQAELETLRQRLAQAQEQIASSDLQRSDLATQVEFQGQQNKTLLQRVQSQLSKATQQIALLESQLTSVAMQRDDLMTKLDAETNKNKALQANLDVKQRELAYRSTSSHVAPIALERSDMNLLSGKAFVATKAAAPLPAIAREDVPVATAKSSSASASADNWETVIVQ